MWNSSANCCRRILSSQNHLPFFPPAQLLVQLLPHAPSLAWFTFSWERPGGNASQKAMLTCTFEYLCVCNGRQSNQFTCMSNSQEPRLPICVVPFAWRVSLFSSCQSRNSLQGVFHLLLFGLFLKWSRMGGEPSHALLLGRQIFIFKKLQWIEEANSRRLLFPVCSQL